MNHFKINNFIFKNNRPYVIAEISSNHQNKLNKIFKLISKAKEAGADAIKIQTYDENAMTINSSNKEFIIKGGIWNNYKLYDLYSKAKTPFEWHEKIFKYSAKIGITCFSSPFNEECADFLEKFNVPAYKVASFEIVDLPLIKHIAKKQKPVILSTGMANIKEIKEAITTVKNEGNNKIIILHCVSNYPTLHKDYNLLTMQDLKNKFKYPVGLSDHTEDFITPIVAAGLGAAVIEKHIKLDDDHKSLDSKFSLNVSEFKKLCKLIKSAWECRGNVDYLKKKERKQIKHRRSIYIVENIKKNEKLNDKNTRKIRPGNGLHPKFYNSIINKKAKKFLKKGTPLKFNLIY